MTLDELDAKVMQVLARSSRPLLAEEVIARAKSLARSYVLEALDRLNKRGRVRVVIDKVEVRICNGAVTSAAVVGPKYEIKDPLDKMAAL